MNKISCIIITRNEAENIRRCLKSVEWVDEIVVVDSGSTDHTKKIAYQFTDRIFDFKWQGFGPAKEFARKQATSNWILSIDADEEVSDQLRDEIMRIIDSEKTLNGYLVPRKSNFLGKWIKHGGWYPDYVLRLFRKEKGEFTQRLVHEEVKLHGESGRLKNCLLHHTDPTFHRYLTKLNEYTSLDARQLREAGRRAGIWDITLRPLSIFFKMYLIKGGFLDGLHGLILAIASAFHVFSKYVKLWHLAKHVENSKRKELNAI